MSYLKFEEIKETAAVINTDFNIICRRCWHNDASVSKKWINVLEKMHATSQRTLQKANHQAKQAAQSGPSTDYYTAALAATKAIADGTCHLCFYSFICGFWSSLHFEFPQHAFFFLLAYSDGKPAPCFYHDYNENHPSLIDGTLNKMQTESGNT